jgi:23S rRNA (adenine2503-C2)-methyltransferase
VVVGMGEPLANYEAVVHAIRIMNAPWGLGVGARKITLSTVGLPKQIRRLADEGLQLNLALSLHAADEALRRELIPWGKVPLSELLDACAYYFKKTGREVTLEYILLEGVNMRAQDATKLAAVAKRLRGNVNLLRYNPVPGLHFQRPSGEAAFAFQQELRARGVNAHIRTSRGEDVDAACGQLRRRLAPEAPATV